MLRWSLLLAALALGGCGNESEVHTYRIKPHLQPGYGNCAVCSIGMTMLAVEDGATWGQTFYRDEFVKGGFTFQWGVEKVVEIVEERYDPGDLQDDPGVRFRFQRVLESHPVEPGSHFEMHFMSAPPGHYADNFLVRRGTGFQLAGKEQLECDTEALCTQLAGYTLGETAFKLELSYPDAQTGHLQLHAIQELPRP